MRNRSAWLALTALAAVMAPAAQAAPAPPPAIAAPAGWTPAQHDAAARTIVLTGRGMSVDDVMAVARHGAKVAYAPEAVESMAVSYGLLLEGAAQGVPIYWFNRGSGAARETVIFAGDPETPENREKISASQLRAFRNGAASGYPPEIADEELVRAIMAVRANGITHNAPSAPLAKMLVDFLNLGITPVVQSRGTVGEGDLAQLGNIGAAMVGAGEVWFRGSRMPAAEALKRAGLTPLAPFAADSNALTSSNAYATAQGVLLVDAARRLLDWADVAYAFDLSGMNSSLTPLATPVQADRPDPWLNWHAARMREMLRGSYLFETDPKRIIQDPESLRASSIRHASAWAAWDRLRRSVEFQLNSSDHNPVVRAGLTPESSWDLATPQMMQYFVKGGPRSKGQSGYILSNANWDPYPLANDVEAFSVAMANLDVAVLNRMQRFTNTMFTVIKANDVLPSPGGPIGGYTPVDLWQEIQSLAVPIAAEGNAWVEGVEDLQAQTRLKLERARKLVDTSAGLVQFDLANGAKWVDVRKAQEPARRFGGGVEAALPKFRAVFPLGASVAPGAVQRWMSDNDAAVLVPAGPARPAGDGR
ncbi:aromatic amino acid lyase [Novosphingobium flavum]|uniref:Aromatic amino acid lyase n=1 Tax=Novosphingobium flavum TaxID=1778672 RepID=A0A7X1FNJ2_9SPHN|nr:aromatic amino acid ammonia-lyase [Novosphingobium flavum]MBC2664023.1 aromatic amino acid lyase [Novosphingobium flavum]